MASNKKQIKQLTIDLIKQSTDAMVKNLAKALDSGAIAIDEFDMKHNRMILPKASPEKIMEHVRENVKILGKDGGLVFNQIHNIQPEVPPSNILALFEAANLYGKY